MEFDLNCKVEVDGREGVVVRTNIFGLRKSKGVEVEFDDGFRKFMSGMGGLAYSN